LARQTRTQAAKNLALLRAVLWPRPESVILNEVKNLAVAVFCFFAAGGGV